jgi:hypothetical protein
VKIKTIIVAVVIAISALFAASSSTSALAAKQPQVCGTCDGGGSLPYCGWDSPYAGHYYYEPGSNNTFFCDPNNGWQYVHSGR